MNNETTGPLVDINNNNNNNTKINISNKNNQMI